MKPTITVDAEALKQVLQALLGPGHYIRELQATMKPTEMFPNNPINVLVQDYNRARNQHYADTGKWTDF